MDSGSGSAARRPARFPTPASYGPAYGVMFVVFLVIGAGGLIARYRKMGVA